MRSSSRARKGIASVPEPRRTRGPGSGTPSKRNRGRDRSSGSDGRPKIYDRSSDRRGRVASASTGSLLPATRTWRRVSQRRMTP